jgi:DNA topoisomerase VI subunit B
MDFFSVKELTTQTGHPVSAWPLVIAKELLDNALDACEDRDIPPVIEIVADASGITVTDNGPGLPEATLKGVLDFTVRASDKEGYVSPARGAQGNALKTLLPMPSVIDPEQGRFIVEAHGQRHVLAFHRGL